MKIFAKIGSVILILASLIGAFGLGCYYTELNQENKTEIFEPQQSEEVDLQLPGETVTREHIVHEIESTLEKISEFSTYSSKYTITDGDKFARKWIDEWNIPGATNSIQVTASGIVKVGYDFNDIKKDVDFDNKKIYISLPEIKVLENHVIWDSIKVVENNNILHPISFSQYQDIISGIEKSGLEDAINKGLLEQGEESIKELLLVFLSDFEGFEVIFL